MKFIKLVVISALLLFALITALSLLLPSDVRISRAININATSEAIYPYLSDLREWRKWNRLVQQADSMHTIKLMVDDSLASDNLHIAITRKLTDTIETNWMQPGGKISKGNFSLLRGERYTVVQWYFDFHLDWYPWQKFQSIIYDKQLGPSMELSLLQLKQIIESSQ